MGKGTAFVMTAVLLVVCGMLSDCAQQAAAQRVSDAVQNWA
jgi:hypothetical protein